MTTMVDPEVKDGTQLDKPEIFHYFCKTDILESTIEGVMKKAVCGMWAVITKVPPPNAAVCPDCAEIYARMKG